MRYQCVVVAACGMLLISTALQAQVQVPPAPWRGAGATPCVGSEGGVNQCPPAPRVTAIRAGRLFDSKSGRILTRQVVVCRASASPRSDPRAKSIFPPARK